MLPIVSVVIICCVSVIKSETCLGQNEKALLSSIQSSLKTLEEKLKGKSASTCPEEWKEYKNHCYFISKDKTKNWSESERQCRDIGGYLVQVTDSSEDSWLVDMMKKAGQDKTNYWMGATDFKEGEWRWTNDLSKVQYSNWDSGQPSGGTGNDCAHFWHSSGYKWDDTSCNSIGFGYVCERAHGSNCLPYSKQFKRRK